MIKNNFGYLLVISKSDRYRYDLMALLLAQSIKRTQKVGYDKIAIVSDSVDHEALLKNSPFVDKFILWKEKSFWDGRSWMDQLSPWDYTVCLDVDMIFFRDTSHWIDYFVNNSFLYTANKVKTYYDSELTSSKHRQTFRSNHLPMLYSAYTFFDKHHEKTKEFFNLQRTIIEHPRQFKNFFLKNDKPEVIGTDEAFSIAAKILDLEKDIAYELEFPRFVHLKAELQYQNSQTSQTARDIGYYYSNFLRVGHYNIIDILHYADKDINLEYMLSKYNQDFVNNSKVIYD